MDMIKKLIIRIVCVAFFIPILLAPQDNSQVSSQEQLFISFLNIPDGEATLLQTSGGKNFLINTGSDYSLESLLKQLQQLHVETIEQIILTNQSAAYQGNLTHIVEAFHVKNVITAQKNKDLTQLVEQAKIVKWDANNSYSLSEYLTCYVHESSRSGEMTLSISYGENSILYMGYSEQPTLKELKQQLHHKPDIIKIPDFAQGNSPSEKLLKEIDPHISIIFNVKSGKLNHALLQRLNESWIDVYQLKKVGTTVIRMNLKDYQIIS